MLDAVDPLSMTQRTYCFVQNPNVLAQVWFSTILRGGRPGSVSIGALGAGLLSAAIR